MRTPARSRRRCFSWPVLPQRNLCEEPLAPGSADLASALHDLVPAGSPDVLLLALCAAGHEKSAHDLPNSVSRVQCLQAAAGQPGRGAAGGAGQRRSRAARPGRARGAAAGRARGRGAGAAAAAARARGREHGGRARHALHQAGVRRARRLLQGVQGAAGPVDCPRQGVQGAPPPRCSRCGAGPVDCPRLLRGVQGAARRAGGRARVRARPRGTGRSSARRAERTRGYTLSGAQ